MSSYLVTGGAGFIGSNLAKTLVSRGDSVRVIDDFSTGRRQNLSSILDKIQLFEGSVCDRELLQEALQDVDYCLHQAAIPSVPRSIEDPISVNWANADGSLNVFLGARDAGVKRVVMASSSSIYGRAKELPLKEELPRAPISPYGVSKATAEMYAEVCSDLYGLDIVCLRYFNVFGPHQNPDSPYSAAIPLFIRTLLNGAVPKIDGDGTQSRDFSYVDNVVLANLLACAAKAPITGVYNVACGTTTSILDILTMLQGILSVDVEPEFRPSRKADIYCSWADISRAKEVFDYEPQVSVRQGLEKTVEWIRDN